MAAREMKDGARLWRALSLMELVQGLLVQGGVGWDALHGEVTALAAEG